MYIILLYHNQTLFHVSSLLFSSLFRFVAPAGGPALDGQPRPNTQPSGHYREECEIPTVPSTYRGAQVQLMQIDKWTYHTIQWTEKEGNLDKAPVEILWSRGPR